MLTMPWTYWTYRPRPDRPLPPPGLRALKIISLVQSVVLTASILILLALLRYSPAESDRRQAWLHAANIVAGLGIGWVVGVRYSVVKYL